MRALQLTPLCLAVFGLACATTSKPAGDLVLGSAEAYKADEAARLDRIRELRAEIKGLTGPRTVDNTLRRYNELLRQIDRLYGFAGLMSNTHPDAAFQEVARGLERDLSQLVNDINLDRGMYDAIAAVDEGGLDPEAKRFRAKVLREFRRAGVDKDDATRARLKALFDEMVKVGQEFDKALNEDQRSLALQPEELEGLPDDFVKGHPVGADGKVTVTTNMPDFLPISTYAVREDVRRRLTELFLSRGYPKNEANLKRLLELRHEYATLLGFPSWAEYQAEDKMVGSAAAIQSFTEEVASVSRPRMAKDLEELLARKQKDVPGATAIQNWDRFHYVEKVRGEKFGFDTQEVRNYFEYRRVLDGMLALYGKLLGLEFTAVDAPVWHPSVKAYELKSGGATIGRFFLDMHPRKGKYSHAAMFPIQTGLIGGQVPMAALVCNFPEPGAEPALMEHQAVVTLFHEFGHLIHHLLARGSSYVNLSGISVEWDFVEAPSQLLEEWAWSPDVLGGFARHVKTEAPIPAELVAKMKAASEFGKGVHVMRQIFFQALSYHLHAADPKGFELEGYTKELNGKYSPFPHIDGTHVYTNFGHLNGYSSMYYTYQWSLSLAKDIFTKWGERGIMDGETAQRYRSLVLEPGGMKDARALVSDFLGREPSLEAYRAWLAN